MTATMPTKRPSNPLKRLRQQFLRHTWYVHPAIHLRVRLSPSELYMVLDRATKPSIQRLQYRNLFSDGRRYLIKPRSDGGFQMMTTHKVIWYPRRRTTASVVLMGDAERLDDETTRILLMSRFRVRYLIDIFTLPSFMTSMLIFMAWQSWVLITSIILLYSLSWMGHRFHAELEAHEMIYFVEKVMEEYVPVATPRLQVKSADIILERDFVEVWDKFVEEMQET